MTEQRVGGALALGSLMVLAAAFASQHLGGLAPCELCIWQRWPWLAAAILGAASVALPRHARLLLALGVLALIVGAGIAGYHVGVEQKWWAGTAACGGTATPNDLEALRRLILATPVVRCDEPALVVLGLSMAAWNGLVALAAAAAVWQSARLGGSR
jgi:disulfide bond formation protein DsbB